MNQIRSKKSSSITQQKIAVACDLYKGQIPKLWHQNAGPCAPPRDWNLLNWIQDFQSRCSHIEKILMLVIKKDLFFCLLYLEDQITLKLGSKHAVEKREVSPVHTKQPKKPLLESVDEKKIFCTINFGILKL